MSHQMNHTNDIHKTYCIQAWRSHLTSLHLPTDRPASLVESVLYALTSEFMSMCVCACVSVYMCGCGWETASQCVRREEGQVVSYSWEPPPIYYAYIKLHSPLQQLLVTKAS